MSILLAKALAAGKLRVRNNAGGPVMVQIYRPDPMNPTKPKHEPIIVPPFAPDFELTKFATPAELARSATLKQMCDPPYNVLSVLPPQ